MAFFAAEFAQQKEAEQAKKAERVEKKEAQKKKKNVNSSIYCERLIVSNIMCVVG